VSGRKKEGDVCFRFGWVKGMSVCIRRGTRPRKLQSCAFGAYHTKENQWNFMRVSARGWGRRQKAQCAAVSEGWQGSGLVGCSRTQLVGKQGAGALLDVAQDNSGQQAAKGGSHGGAGLDAPRRVLCREALHRRMKGGSRQQCSPSGHRGMHRHSVKPVQTGAARRGEGRVHYTPSPRRPLTSEHMRGRFHEAIPRAANCSGRCSCRRICRKQGMEGSRWAGRERLASAST